MLNRGLRRLIVCYSIGFSHYLALNRLTIVFPQVSIDEIRAHNRELADG